MKTIVLIDLPLQYSLWKKQKTRTAESYYHCMSDAELIDLRDDMQRAFPNSILFVWATGPKMEFIYSLLRQWGWIPKTIAFTWVKTTKQKMLFRGLGNWTRSNAEFIIVATRGKVKIDRLKKNTHSVVFYERLKHSAKPSVFNELIKDTFRADNYVELFARRHQTGWQCTGDELDGMDIKRFLNDYAAKHAECTRQID